MKLLEVKRLKIAGTAARVVQRPDKISLSKLVSERRTDCA